jgi:uncharacterized protein YjdB
VFNKNIIVFVLFCLILSSLYSPNLAFSQEINSNGIHEGYVETIERTDIFNKEQKIVGEFNSATQLKISTIQDGKVYFQWDRELAYIEEKSTKMVNSEDITFTLVNVETGVTSEKIVTHLPTEVYSNQSLETTILKLAPEVEYSVTKIDGEYYSITVGNREGIVKSGDVELLSPSNELDKTFLDKSSTLQESSLTQLAIEKPSINYATHVQDIGWQNQVSDGEMSGTEGKEKRLESIKISVANVQDLGVEYSTHVQDQGWLDYVSDGIESGTTGKAKQLEAIKIELTGTKAVNYDIYYRVHAQDYGWMEWVKNGELAGTTGKAKRLEAIEILIVNKGGEAPGSTENPLPTKPSVVYSSHVETYGWLDYVADGELSGTEGQAKRLEAIKIKLKDAPYSGDITYSTHIQYDGWLNNVSNDEISGTVGPGKRMEAIKIGLTGEIANYYDVYYRVHSQNFGWLGWAKNGEPAGTEGLSLRIEAIEIVMVEKGGAAPGTTEKPFLTKPSVVYSTHVETYGWLNNVADGAMSGTEGQGKRLEAIKIHLQNSPYSGDITYSTHVQYDGWLNDVSNGDISGTVGPGKRMEAIKLNLTGDIANYFDVYYRVHVESYGWLGWARNGMKAGSEGLSKRLEAIEIKLVPKGQGESVSEKAAFKKPYTVFLDPGHGGSDPGAVAGGIKEAYLNLAVAQKVQSLLLSRGYSVYMSRIGDTNVELIDRSKMANSLNPDIFVSIHTNSTGSSSTTATGIEDFYYQIDPNNPSKINADMATNPDRMVKSVKLASLIQEKVIAYTNAVNRGADGADFSVLRETAVPATLIEIGFINNASDRQKLVSDSYQNILAQAIADGIDQYFRTN